MNEWLQRAARARARLGDPLGGERPDETFEATWRRTIKQRLVLVLALLGAWATLLLGRLVVLQIVQHSDLLARSLDQQHNVIVAPAGRGDIVDRYGRVLAYSVDGASIEAAPQEIKDDAATAAALCSALGDCTAAELAELTAKFGTTKWFAVRKARAVSQNQIDAVRALELPGIYLIAGTRRWYPLMNVAAHLVGFVSVDGKGRDNVGAAGIESKFDSVIRGREGWIQVQSDAKGQRTATRVGQAPTGGSTVELTIDLALQYAVERELAEAVRARRARGGTVVVMNPMTGEILAMASLPTFNPNALGRLQDDLSRDNRATQHVYEPGSTLKIVIASAALEEGLLKPADLVDTNPGSLKVTGRSKLIKDDHPIGVASFEDVIVHSSNVGAVMTGRRIGAERLGRYLKRFGFGERLTTDFGGESRGVVFDSSQLDESGLASVSMGYQISVTALQMATAMSAIANGGQLVQPRLVRATITDGVRTATEPKVIRQAIAPETAGTMTTILEQVVQRGTAKAAGLTRYQVAGKTGTAKKLVDKKYSDVEFNASFVGFVPSRRPAVTIVVVIDTPRGGQYYGGQVAAPVFKRVAEAALRQLGVPPTINPVPPVVTAAGSSASTIRPRATGRDLTTTRVAIVDGDGRMPDVIGKSGREAVWILNQAGLAPRLEGNGFVVAQSPEAGAEIAPGARAVVQLSRGPDKPGVRR
jgi:cell division protein FtsI (penicillin-binding protein 3)